MKQKTKVIVDAMGGDFGPSVVVPAALAALSRHKNLSLILVGQQDAIENALKNTKGNIKKASKLINTTVRKFSYKAEKYNINYKDYRI